MDVVPLWLTFGAPNSNPKEPGLLFGKVLPYWGVSTAPQLMLFSSKYFQLKVPHVKHRLLLLEGWSDTGGKCPM